MKLFLISLSIILTLNSYCQTKVIAHKSRSGNMAYFSALKGPDNIGNPPEMMENLRINTMLYPILDTSFKLPIRHDSIIKLSDSLIIFIPADTLRPTKTITNNPLFTNPEISLDSIRRQRPGIIFIGFDSINTKTAEEDSVKILQKKSTQYNPIKNTVSPIIPKPNNLNNDQKGSYNKDHKNGILFLSLFGLVFILLFINLSRLRSKQYI